jgi:hypothetical protein
MSGATEAAFKEMKHRIKLIIYTKMYGLKLQPTLIADEAQWMMTVFTE